MTLAVPKHNDPLGSNWEDEGRIRALIGRAAYLVDLGQPEDYTEIYAVDGVWEMAAERQIGLTAIIAAAKTRRDNGNGGPGSNTKHMVLPMDIHFTSSDDAVAVSYLSYWTCTDTSPTVMLVATYTDTLRREPEGWRIIHRAVTRG